MKIRLSVFSVLLGICLVSWGQVGDLPRSHAEDEGMSRRDAAIAAARTWPTCPRSTCIT